MRIARVLAGVAALIVVTGAALAACGQSGEGRLAPYFEDLNAINMDASAEIESGDEVATAIKRFVTSLRDLDAPDQAEELHQAWTDAWADVDRALADGAEAVTPEQRASFSTMIDRAGSGLRALAESAGLRFQPGVALAAVLPATDEDAPEHNDAATAGPPEGMFSSDEGSVAAGIGSYCWTEPDAGAGLCADAIGITTAPDDLNVSADGEVRLDVDLDITNANVAAHTLPAEPVATGENWRAWSPAGEGQVPQLTASIDEHGLSFPAALPAGEYVVSVFLQVPQGDVSYGVVLIVDGGGVNGDDADASDSGEGGDDGQIDNGDDAPDDDAGGDAPGGTGGSRPGGSTAGTALGSAFTIGAGQSIGIGDTGVALSFDGVRNDSRCPTDVDCVWAGEATLVFSAMRAGLAEHGEVVIGPAGVADFELAGLHFEASSLLPDPISDRSIPPRDYQVTLIATRGSAAPPPPSTDPGYEQTRVRAPIDNLDMRVAESFPPQYFLEITSGLPSGCAEFDGTSVSREGTTILVDVWNLEPAPDALIACTAIYGIVETNLNLGSDFEPGVEYTVRVNDEAISFTAQ